MTDATTTQSAIEKLQSAEEDINRRILGQNQAVRASVLAWLTKDHVALVGTHGTAKTMLSKVTAEYFEASTGYRLLSRYSTPDELFGPVSIKGLKNDKYERCMAGTLAEVQAATVDEVFKANSALLNSLLGWMNERVIDTTDSPLEVLTGISNEYPRGLESSTRQNDDDSIFALWDRFLYRVEIESVFAKRDCWMNVVAGSLQEERNADPISALELRELRSQVDDLVRDVAAAGPEGQVPIMLRTLGEYLISEGVSLSERRWRKAVRVLAASAVMNGRDSITDLDFTELQMVLWEAPDQRQLLKKALRQVENPTLMSVRGLVDHAIQEMTDARSAGEERGFAITQALEVGRRAVRDIKGVRATAPERLLPLIDESLEKLMTAGKEARAARARIEKSQEF